MRERIKKNERWENNKDSFGLTKYYAGFFHTGLKGMKNRPIFIMDGYGGQIFTIDFERGRIVATIAIHRDFNWKKMGYSVIKKVNKSSSNRWKTKKISCIYFRRILSFHVPSFLNPSTCNA